MSDEPSGPELSPPPRPVPLSLTVRTVMGGFLTQFGWAFVAFGMIFVWVFNPGDGLGGFVRFRGELASAEGTSVGWTQTSLRINETPVFETEYAFEVGGQPLQGASYGTGRYVAEGEPVMVEYRPSDPSISRISGMRASAAGLMVSFIYVFPLVGAVMAGFGMRKGIKARGLMANGELALGVLKDKEATSTRINEQPVYRLTFEFEAEAGGTYTAEARTHLPHKLEDETRERLVYDPSDPGYATLLDELPLRPVVNERGHFEAGSARDRTLALLNLALPAFALLGHAAYTVIWG